MINKPLAKVLICAWLLLPAFAWGATPTNSEFNPLRNQIAALDAQLSILEERINNHEAIIDSLRHETAAQVKAATAAADAKISNGDNRITRIEEHIERTSRDIKQIREHVNQFTSLLQKQQISIDKLEQSRTEHDAKLLRLEAAFREMILGLRGNENPSLIQEETYLVQAGDSIDKIARRYKVSPAKLRERNGLKTDTIRVGQKLTIPVSENPS